MNRVKRTSRRYEEAKPEIDELRKRNKRATILNKMRFRGKTPTDLSTPETANLMDFTVKELRKMAKAANLKGYSKLKKDELVRRLS